MKKDIALLIVIILAAAAVIKGVDIQSVDEYYSLHSDDTANAAHTVTLTVDCSDILDNYDMLDKNLRDECYVPSDGIVMPAEKYVLCEGVIEELCVPFYGTGAFFKAQRGACHAGIFIVVHIKRGGAVRAAYYAYRRSHAAHAKVRAARARVVSRLGIGYYNGAAGIGRNGVFHYGHVLGHFIIAHAECPFAHCLLLYAQRGKGIYIVRYGMRKLCASALLYHEIACRYRARLGYHLEVASSC